MQRRLKRLRLESELGEEPLVLARLVSLLKGLLDGLLGVLSESGLSEGLGANNVLEVGAEVQGVSSGHHVVVVDDLDEGLDLGSLGNLLGVHVGGNLQRVSLDSGNQSVGEGVSLGSLIVGLDDHHLLTSVSASNNES